MMTPDQFKATEADKVNKDLFKEVKEVDKNNSLKEEVLNTEMIFQILLLKLPTLFTMSTGTKKTNGPLWLNSILNYIRKNKNWRK